MKEVHLRADERGRVNVESEDDVDAETAPLIEVSIAPAQL